MGEDKSLLPFGSYKTLTEFQYAKLSKIFKNVYISCKDKNKFNFDANFIEDDNTDKTYAPTAGFVAAFKTLSSENIFVLSVDSPFVNEEIITLLIENRDTELDAIIAKTDRGIEPLCGIYNRSLEEKFQIMQNTDNHKLGFLLKKSQTKYLHFSNQSLFRNLNHPQEYKEAYISYLNEKSI